MLLAGFSCFWCVHEEGVAGVAQEAVDLLRSGSTHTASFLYGFNGAAGGRWGGERTGCRRGGGGGLHINAWNHSTVTLHLPVYELGDGPEVVAHVESVNIVDWRQAQVQLQGLLPVLPFHLQGCSDALTFTLLQLCQVCQQAGALLGAAAPQQAHAGSHQQCQRAVVVTCSLERT